MSPLSLHHPAIDGLGLNLGVECLGFRVWGLEFIILRFFRFVQASLLGLGFSSQVLRTTATKPVAKTTNYLRLQIYSLLVQIIAGN